MDHSGHRWHWPLLLPLAGVLMFGMATFLPLNAGVASLAALALGGSVIGAVHHAEVVAQRVGEPFGTLVLAVAVTAIETGLLVWLLFPGDVGREILVRDTLYATVMIIASGVVGLCVLL